MSHNLNNLELNDELLASLYARSLVQLTPEQSAWQKNPVIEGVEEQTNILSETQPVKYLGNNEKRVLVLIKNKKIAFLPEEQLALLTKMLAACKMNIGDVAIVNMAETQDLQEAISQLLPEKLLAFGALNEDFNLPLFEIEMRDGAVWLNAPSLEELLQEKGKNPPLKTSLWNSMQQLFDLK